MPGCSECREENETEKNSDHGKACWVVYEGWPASWNSDDTKKPIREERARVKGETAEQLGQSECGKRGQPGGRGGRAGAGRACLTTIPMGLLMDLWRSIALLWKTSSKASHRRTNTAWLPFCGVPGGVKFIETGTKMVATSGWRAEGMTIFRILCHQGNAN